MQHDDEPSDASSGEARHLDDAREEIEAWERLKAEVARAPRSRRPYLIGRAEAEVRADRELQEMIDRWDEEFREAEDEEVLTESGERARSTGAPFASCDNLSDATTVQKVRKVAMANSQEHQVKLSYDTEGAVWMVNDSSIPGLYLQDTTLEGLIRKVGELAPRLITDNLGPAGANAALRIDIPDSLADRRTPGPRKT